MKSSFQNCSHRDVVRSGEGAIGPDTAQRNLTALTQTLTCFLRMIFALHTLLEAWMWLYALLSFRGNFPVTLEKLFWTTKRV